MTPTTVVISKKWNSPSIKVELRQDGIELEMSVPDYLDSILAQIGNPTLIMTKANLAEKVRLARLAVEHEMKEASKFAI